VTRTYPALAEKGRGVGRHHLVTGYVYFARHHPNGHYIKIGWAVDPTMRLRTWLLEILAAVPGTRDDEDDIQDRFMDIHYEGEWFKPGPDLLDFIDRIVRRPAAFAPSALFSPLAEPA
jgi:hypothetical protein